MRTTSLLLLAMLATLAACGTGSPTDATVEDFWAAQQGLVAHLPRDGGGDLPSDAQWAQAFHDWGEQMEETGTPEDMPAAARAGFEDLLDVVREVQPKDFENGMAADVEDPPDAFVDYVDEACNGPSSPGGGLPPVPSLPARG